MSSDVATKTEILDVLKILKDDLASDEKDISDANDSAIDIIPGTTLDEEFLKDQHATTNLSLLNESSWGGLRVSKISFFSEMLWNFEKEGSPIYLRAQVHWNQGVDKGVALTDIECTPLCTLIKGCLYYYLPQNCILGWCRSYNTVTPMFRGFIRLARFLYGRGLYVDKYGNGSFRCATQLTEDDVNSLVADQPTDSTKLQAVFALQFWNKLSDAGFLPERYRVKVSGLNAIISNLYKEKKDNSGTYLPISLDTLSIVVPYCIDLVEKHAEDIILAYDRLHPLFADKAYKSEIGFEWLSVLKFLREHKTHTWNIDDFFVEDGAMNQSTRYRLLKVIRSHPDWSAYRKKHFPIKRKNIERAPHQKIRDIANEMDIDMWNIDEGSIYFNLRDIRHTFLGIFSTMRDACFIILCLVTGMRRSEVLHLEAHKAWPVPGSNQEFRLEFIVFKTSEASQGEVVIIPIPEIAFKAYKVLERLTENARLYGKSNYLSTNITLHFGKPMHPNTFNMGLTRFWEDLDIEEDIHSHMFRKTLAMFAVYTDPRNISVIKYLFSHHSLAMTLAYIVKIPGLSDDIKLAIIEHNTELLAEVLAAANNETIGGKCGLRIKSQLKSSKTLARLNDDGRESLRQYVDSILEQGLRILHRCPMNVICTNLHESIAHVGPEVCDCEVTNCDFAIFTEKSVPDLVEQVKFHDQWIRHPNVSEGQVTFSKRIIQDCVTRLAEVQGEEATRAEFPQYFGLVA